MQKMTNANDGLNISQNATPVNKRAATVRSNSQNPHKDSNKKERTHYNNHASSSKVNKNSEQSNSKKKNTFTNFMSNT